jgi:hypothetical protein
MILRDLTQAKGLSELLAATGGTDSFFNYPERIDGVRNVAQQAIASSPAMANTQVRIMPNIANAYYDYENNEILLGLVNPDALAHELGHAENLKQKGLYTKILRVAQGVAKINNIAAVPVMLGLRTMVKDEDTRNDILSALSAVSSAVAAPLLLEEASASYQALHNAPDKLQALKTLAPAFLAHAGMSLAPVGIYQAGKI